MTNLSQRSRWSRISNQRSHALRSMFIFWQYALCLFTLGYNYIVFCSVYTYTGVCEMGQFSMHSVPSDATAWCTFQNLTPLLWCHICFLVILAAQCCVVQCCGSPRGASGAQLLAFRCIETCFMTSKEELRGQVRGQRTKEKHQLTFGTMKVTEDFRNYLDNNSSSLCSGDKTNIAFQCLVHWNEFSCTFEVTFRPKEKNAPADQL